MQIFKGANLELTNEDLTEWEAQGKDEERQEEEVIYDTVSGKRIFFV